MGVLRSTLDTGPGPLSPLEGVDAAAHSADGAAMHVDRMDVGHDAFSGTKEENDVFDTPLCEACAQPATELLVIVVCRQCSKVRRMDGFRVLPLTAPIARGVAVGPVLRVCHCMRAPRATGSSSPHDTVMRSLSPWCARSAADFPPRLSISAAPHASARLLVLQCLPRR